MRRVTPVSESTSRIHHSASGRHALTALLCLGLAGAAAAEESAAKPVALGDMVVTASRSERDANTVPANVTVITADDIVKTNAQNLPDVLKYYGDTSVGDYTGTGRTTVVDVRGFGETAIANTLVLVDGRQINAPDMSGVDWTTIPLERIERVEIVRGGNSVLYGDRAVGGVINILTKKGAAKNTLTADTTFGSYGYFRQALGYAGSTGPLTYSVNGSYTGTNGYRENSNFRNKTSGLSLAYDDGGWFAMDLSAGIKDDRYGMPGELREGVDRRSASSPLDYAETETTYLHLTPKLRLGDAGELSLALGYSEKDSESYWFDWWGNAISRWRILDWTVGPKYTLTADVAGHDNTLTLGVDFRGSDLHDITLGLGDMHRHEAGYYVHDTFSIVNDRLFLDTGYRFSRVNYDYDQYDSLAHSIDSARAGLTYVYRPRCKLFLGFDRSFRTQMLEELGGPGFNVPLDNVQISKQYQAGIRHTFSDRVAAGATLFQIDTDNEIFYDPWNGWGRNTTYDRTRRRGVELDAELCPCDTVTLFANYTYLIAELEGGDYDGNRVPGVAKHSGSVGVAWSPCEQVTLDVRSRWVADKELISDWANVSDGWEGRNYFVTDARVTYRPIEQLEIYVGVNNVFNEEYSEFGVWSMDWNTWTGPHVFTYPSPERNFIGGVKFTQEF